jgi:hypothetical protein
MDFLSHPAFWIVLAAVSELIGMSPLNPTASFNWYCKHCLHLSRESLNPTGQPLAAAVQHSITG